MNNNNPKFITPSGKFIFEYANYEEYLNSFVTRYDREYLEDKNICAKLIELGYSGPREGFTEEEFNTMKEQFELKKRKETSERLGLPRGKGVLSVGKTYEDGVMRALQMREEGNRSGKNSSIFFLRMYNKRGQEVSAFIDYAHRLVTEDFGQIFDLKKRFLPQKNDLSYFNWDTSIVISNDSPNYEVNCRSIHGMVFRNKRDKKIVNPDAFGPPGDNSSRTKIDTTEYLSAFVLDHYNRPS